MIKQLNMERLNKIFSLLLQVMKENEEIVRDQSLDWSISHMYSCSQLSKILAKKRGLDIEIAGIAGAIHDLAIIKTGKFDLHGELGAPMVKDFLIAYNIKFGNQSGFISENDINTIVEATAYHTKKKEQSQNEMNELIKDADSLDRFLHGKDILEQYVPRIKRALKDLEQNYDEY